MFKINVYFFTIVILVVFFNKYVNSQKSNINEFIDNNSVFALKLYREIASIEGNSFVFSPFSIQITGGLLYLGANETTSKLLQDCFNFKLSAKDIGNLFQNILKKYQYDDSLKIANGIFIAEELEIARGFSNDAKRKFNSTIKNIQFSDIKSATKRINRFVRRNTNGKIRQLLSPDALDPQTIMLLINAISFQAEWKEKFLPMLTQKDKFYSTSTKIIEVDTMYGFKRSYKLGTNQEKNYIVAEIGFIETDISFQIIIPSKLNLNIDHIENLFTKSGLNNIIEDAQIRKVEGQVQIPKFLGKTDIDLKLILSRLGMTNLFSNEADFSKFLKMNEPLSISKAVHKAYIDIHENGAEAAAATGYELEYRIANGNMRSFVANQSFIYLLKGSKGEIYFMGRYTGVYK
ncbi:antichymotrypsin-2-like [Condylostylus longicornis]|uniref:antichymotrypsin-2-like n=1 Tax=Condylostylus longicornis TaxID=2530218 RepID=UPI00244E2A74|nr:antichymotrypsin-2-like [Condylostylus longicornis]